MSLTSLKSDCSSTAEIIAETGKDIGAHTKISSIKVTKITPGRLIDGKNNNGEPDPSQNKKEYQAQLSIRFDQANQYRSMRDIELPIMFTTWDGSGNIIHCGASTDHNARLTSMNYRLRNTIYAHGGLLEQYDNMSGQADTNRGNIDENANTIKENDNSILQANTDIEANRILIASKQSKPHSHPLALSGHNHNSHITTREPDSIIEDLPPQNFCPSGTDYCVSTTRYHCNQENGQITQHQNSVHCGFEEVTTTPLEFKKIYDEAVVELNNAMAISCSGRWRVVSCSGGPRGTTCLRRYLPNKACLNRRAAAIAVATAKVNKAKADMDNAKAQIEDF